MSLEEQAEQVKDILDEINRISLEGMDLYRKVLEKNDLEGEIVEWSTANKQKFINRGKVLIEKLRSLVGELP